MLDEQNYVPPTQTTCASIPFGTRTEISLYYTSGVRPTISDTWTPGSELTEAMDSTEMGATSTEEPFTQATTFDATRIGVLGTAPSSTSTAGAAAGQEVKAAGGLLMAIIGATVML